PLLTARRSAARTIPPGHDRRPGVGRERIPMACGSGGRAVMPPSSRSHDAIATERLERLRCWSRSLRFDIHRSAIAEDFETPLLEALRLDAHADDSIGTHSTSSIAHLLKGFLARAFVKLGVGAELAACRQGLQAAHDVADGPDGVACEGVHDAKV